MWPFTVFAPGKGIFGANLPQEAWAIVHREGVAAMAICAQETNAMKIYTREDNWSEFRRYYGYPEEAVK
jgi:hypothetical protein